MNLDDNISSDRLTVYEIQLLLDEKRTALSVMSTGIFILVAQLLINSILIATSQFYSMMNVIHLVIPFYIINVCLFILAGFLIIHSLSRIRHFNHLISQLKKKHNLYDGLIG